MLRLFGTAGLYAYVVIATLAANIQVLKPVAFSFYTHPIPLGTVLFATTYLCTDILAEYYGHREARRAVLLGFCGYFLWTSFMLLTIAFRPLPVDSGAFDLHADIAAVFTPSGRFFVSAMAAYLISQYHDVLIYRLFKRLTRGRFLWLRNNASTMLSALLDNTVFSILAWVVLAPEPLSWDIVIFTYILGTYLLRVAVALLDTPVIYLARHCLPLADRP